MAYSKTMILGIKDTLSELNNLYEVESWLDISILSDLIVNLKIVAKEGDSPSDVLNTVITAFEHRIDPSLIQRPASVSSSKGRGRKKKGGIDPDKSVMISLTLSEDE